MIRAVLITLFPVLTSTLLRSQISLLFLLLLATMAVPRLAAARRVRLLSIAPAVIPLLILAISLLPGIHTRQLTAQERRNLPELTEAGTSIPEVERLSTAAESRPAEPGNEPVPRGGAVQSEKPEPRPQIPRIEVNNNLAALASGCWLAGSLLSLGLYVRQRQRLKQFIRTVVPLKNPHWRQALQKLQADGNDLTGIFFASLPGYAGGPFVTGCAKPVVILPENTEGWARGQYETALLHELDHIRSHDLSMRGVLLIMRSLTWCLAGWRRLERLLANAQEERCDAFVLRQSRDGLAYARLLLELARNPDPVRIPGAQGAAGQGSLERRITMILSGHTNSRAAGRPSGHWLAAACAAFPLMLLLIVVTPNVVAAAPGTATAAAGTLQAGATEESTESIRVLGFDGTELAYHNVDTSIVPKLFPIAQDAAHASLAFGPAHNPFTGEPSIHEGLDLSTFRSGDPVIATMSAEILAIGFTMDQGNYIILRQGPTLVCYFHLKSFAVQKGQLVEAGSIIGQIGNTGLSTGPHLHYQIHICTDTAATPVIGITASSDGGEGLLLPEGYSIDPLPLLRLGGWTGSDPS